MGYYAVAIGRKPGIYRTWLDAEKQVHRLKGAVHKRFPSYQQARGYIMLHNPGYFDPPESAPLALPVPIVAPPEPAHMVLPLPIVPATPLDQPLGPLDLSLRSTLASPPVKAGASYPTFPKNSVCTEGILSSTPRNGTVFNLSALDFVSPIVTRKRRSESLLDPVVPKRICLLPGVDSDNGRIVHQTKTLNKTIRYIDDICTLGVENFLDIAKDIYPASLPLEKTNNSFSQAPFLDLFVNLKSKITLY